jgi:hypothetical protein
MKNQHGLSRPIPEAVKRAVRQRCGFGCVVCGSVITEYEHFDPPFADAVSHDARGITLLCPSCHTKKDKGLLSVQSIEAHNSNPIAKRVGFSREFLMLTDGTPVIHLVTNTFSEVENIVEIDGRSLFSIRKSDELSAPVEISAEFCDEKNTKIAEIVKNEWRSFNDNWDVKFVGNRLRVWSGPDKIELDVEFNLPGEISIHRFAMNWNGYGVRGDQNSAVVSFGGRTQGIFYMKNSFVAHCKSVICIGHAAR